MKVLRRILAGSLSLLLCLSLTGCRQLDEMRKTHGFYQEDGTILLGDSVYKQLPYCEQLSPNMNFSVDIYVTEPDVPLLLADIAGDMFYLSEDTVFMSYDAAAVELKPSGSDSPYYCRMDRYDEIVADIKKGFNPQGYCYSYDEKVENDDSFNIETRFYSLSTKEANAIETVLATVDPTELPEGTSLDYELSVALEACSTDLLFREYAFTLLLIEGKYYLLDDKYHLALYTVPTHMSDVFEGILKTALEADVKLYGSEEYMDYYKSSYVDEDKDVLL